jgi:pyruvate,orthophosphate dikinase
MTAEKKYVYDFSEGRSGMKALLGGKGANLAEMTGLGLPVPPGFTITTEACRYYSANREYPPGLKKEIDEHLARLEEKMGKKLGDDNDPLLVSVRSGAAISMPGMMDTVLNLGLNDRSVQGLIKQTGDARFAYDAYRRFIQMFSSIVMEIDRDHFEEALTELKRSRKVELDVELKAKDWQELVKRFKAIVRKQAGRDFPAKPREQLDLAIKAVFRSWMNPRAIIYRRTYNIPDDLGTAVNVQSMVFGNKGDDSATGVCFTRDPNTGEKRKFGEYLTNAQGEDVVAGIRTPKGLDQMKKELPALYKELTSIMDKLEKHYRDMQDIEFTMEQGKLYMLQTRTGKRSAAAAVKIAVDMVGEGLISKEEAVGRVQPSQLDLLLHPCLDPGAKYEVAAVGLPASPGAAVGEAVFDADTAKRRGEQGEKVILVRWETTPDDMHGIVKAQGILTSRGGMTSHAAVVARGMGKPCVCGAEAVKIDQASRCFEVDGKVVREGDPITIDGTTGRVILKAEKLIEPSLEDPNLRQILAWADDIRRLKVRTNADTPEDARRARKFGAEGIGLCRIEHMLLTEPGLSIIRRFILAEKKKEQEAALEELLPLLREDFKGILKAMNGLPVTVRLLDPPLHEFLPKLMDLRMEMLVKQIEGDQAGYQEREKLYRKVEEEHEQNPMLGLRGCRLGITYPGITRIQVRAIIEAACELKKEGKNPIPEIMVPLVAFRSELANEKKKVLSEARKVMKEQGVKVPLMVGTMIELPRAALTAGEIAAEAEFFSFGTNDLTQTTLGFSRDDAGKFIRYYMEQGLLEEDPFESLDTTGVGRLVRMAAQEGRARRPRLKLGICGEHGGDPRSIHFCHEVGLDYVSCSPFRVPVARLAAAHAQLGKVEDATR